ncbi:MAG: GNAT family N-acetyltransferase [Pleurocapsa minor GSE-CHR-MK-17-07R]|jgi:phosphinothricin acetyltransferase|nr:GNAT family N-acetyltransferase [Pleurocapsa minor GSE-CHR-MK 17-07R]
MTHTDLSIRPMLAEDWAAVAAIYEEGMNTGRATFESSLPEWEVWDAAHVVQPRLVAERDGAVLGWAVLSPISARAAYAGVAEVTIYVAGAARGAGVGRALLDALIAASEQAGFWTLQSVIFRANEASIALHTACGFRLVGYRERIAMRDGQWHDTVLMERRSTVNAC